MKTAAGFPPPQPHDPPRELLPDLLFVHGTFRMAPGMTINRNMVVLRDRGQLTLINAIRLNEAGEASLEAYGEVENVVRLGPLHGLDDPYTVQRFGARFWSQSGGDRYAEPLPDVVITDETTAPVEDAEIIILKETVLPECLLLWRRHGGVLIACDAVQNWESTSRCSLLGKIACHAFGFMHPANIGPFWIKLMTKPGGSLKPDFDRILAHEFDHLVGAHGQPLIGGARTALTKAVARVL